MRPRDGLGAAERAQDRSEGLFGIGRASEVCDQTTACGLFDEGLLNVLEEADVIDEPLFLGFVGGCLPTQARVVRLGVHDAW